LCDGGDDEGFDPVVSEGGDACDDDFLAHGVVGEDFEGMREE
jgi:hypothetical protein